MYKLTKNAGAVTKNGRYRWKSKLFSVLILEDIIFKVSFLKIILVYSCRRKYQYNEDDFRFQFIACQAFKRDGYGNNETLLINNFSFVLL